MTPYNVKYTPKDEEWVVKPLGLCKTTNMPYRENLKPDTVCINVMAHSPSIALDRAEKLLEAHCFASIFPSCQSVLAGKLWRKDFGQI